MKISILTTIIILVACIFFASGVYAQTGQARVYLNDSVVTPNPEIVPLYDLDGSGYLQNQYVVLLVLAGSPYDHRAYSLEGNFIYEPLAWDIHNIIPEGIKFDAASTYYYLTYMRKYLEERFGFNQSDAQLQVYLFADELTGGVDPDVPSITGGVPNFVPGDTWGSDHYRCATSVMHEYTHIVFMRYRQNLEFQQGGFGHPNTQACGINEALAVFWPCSILNEPVYGSAVCAPGYQPFDLRDDVSYQVGGDFENIVRSLSTTFWDLREALGQQVCEQLLWDAMELVPHQNATFRDMRSVLCQVDKSQYGGVHRGAIIKVFNNHNIGHSAGVIQQQVWY